MSSEEEEGSVPRVLARNTACHQCRSVTLFAPDLRTPADDTHRKRKLVRLRAQTLTGIVDTHRNAMLSSPVAPIAKDTTIAKPMHPIPRCWTVHGMSRDEGGLEQRMLETRLVGRNAQEWLNWKRR